MQWATPGFAAALFESDESPKCLVDGYILRVKGKKADQINVVGPVFDGMFDIGDMARDRVQLVELLETCLRMEITYSLTGQDQLEVLWRTLMDDHNRFPRSGDCTWQAEALKFAPCFEAYIAHYFSTWLKRCSKDHLQGTIDQLKYWEAAFQSSMGYPSVSRILEITEMWKEEDGISTHPLYDDANVICTQVSIPNERHLLFTTSQKWLGKGLYGVQTNDEIWLLERAAVPFVLRPYGESQYQLVWDAYIHGIMFGELLTVAGGTEEFREIEII